MNKNLINSLTRKLGFEVHGLGYMQSVQKPSFKEDPFLKQKEILGTASTILDVGANRGDTVRQYKELFPNAKVHAFEPFEESYNILVSNVHDLTGIFPHRFAVAAEEGTSTFHVNQNFDTNSLLPSRKSGMSSDKQVETIERTKVKTISLDDFVKQAQIREIDILKMDIQGGELQALRGAERLLEKKRIKLIYLETWFVRQYVGSPLFHDIAAHLSGHGYTLQDLYNPIYSNGSLAWCDAVFLPR